MAISYVGVGTSGYDNSGAASTMTPGLPAGWAADDLLLMAVYFRNNANSFMPTVAGWTKMGSTGTASTGTLGLYYRVAQAGDTAPGVFVNDGTLRGCKIAAFRGVDPSSPIGGIGWAATSNGTAQNIGPITAGSTAVAGECVVVVGHKRDDWTSVATLTGDGITWNEINEELLSTGYGFVWDYGIAGAAGAISSKTFVVTGGTSIQWQGEVISLNPAPSGSALTLTVDDTMQVTEGVGKSVGKAVADTAHAGDAVTKAFGKTTADTAQLAEGVGKGVGKTVADTASLTETISKAAGKALADTAQLAESLSKGVGKTVADTATLSESIAKSIATLIEDTAEVSEGVVTVLTPSGPIVPAPYTELPTGGIPPELATGGFPVLLKTGGTIELSTGGEEPVVPPTAGPEPAPRSGGTEPAPRTGGVEPAYRTGTID